MRKLIALLLSSVLVVSGCAPQNVVMETVEVETTTVESIKNIETLQEVKKQKETREEEREEIKIVETQMEMGEGISYHHNFEDMSNPEVLKYLEDSVYLELLDKYQEQECLIENVEAVYLSNEYIQEMAYNSQNNIYFGYTIDELEGQFQDNKYVFTVGEDGKTVVHKFESYDDTFNQIIVNMAEGAGLILIGVTIIVVTKGGGLSTVRLWLSSNAISYMNANALDLVCMAIHGIQQGIETENPEQALKSTLLEWSEDFKCEMMIATVPGIHTASKVLDSEFSEFTISDVIKMQKDLKYPLAVIKSLTQKKQYEFLKKLKLNPQIIKRIRTLSRTINSVDLVVDGLNNLQRMIEGLSPIDESGNEYELYDIGAEEDATRIILTEEEYKELGDGLIWINQDQESWEKEKSEFWKAYAEWIENGEIR